MAKRIYDDINISVERDPTQTIQEWLSIQLAMWSARGITLSAEIDAMRERFVKWKVNYIVENCHRVDFESDDEWNARMLEYYQESEVLDDEMTYLKLCVEDETEKVLL